MDTYKRLTWVMAVHRSLCAVVDVHKGLYEAVVAVHKDLHQVAVVHSGLHALVSMPNFQGEVLGTST